MKERSADQDKKPKPLRQRVEVTIPEDWPYDFHDPKKVVEERADYRAGRMYLMEKLIVWAVLLSIILAIIFLT